MNETDKEQLFWFNSFSVSNVFFFLYQVYVKAHSCPCIRCHLFDPYFIALSNENYIAIFSQVLSGPRGIWVPNQVQFQLGWGEACVRLLRWFYFYIYNGSSTKLDRKIKAYEQACLGNAFHPVLPYIIVSCSWHGDISSVWMRQLNQLLLQQILFLDHLVTSFGNYVNVTLATSL